VKKIVLFLMVLATACTLAGCSNGQADTTTADKTTPATLQAMLEQANLTKAEIHVCYEMVVPDSAKPKMTEWITKTVSAASLHMTGGDYEDPDDLVEEVCDQAKEIFSCKEKINKLVYLAKGSDSWQYVEYQDLTPSQKKVFDFLNQ
jgi:hypothetical protein